MKRRFGASALIVVILVFLPALLAAAETAERPWLGITLQDPPDGQGVKVLDVAPGSPAARADLRVGDRIFAVGRQPVASARELAQRIGEASVAGPIEIWIRRQGKKLTITAQLILSDRPEARRAQAQSALDRHDYEEAARLLEPLAAAGDTYAQGAYGWLLVTGRGVAQDFAAGVRYTELAAAAGSREAQFNLGNTYQHGLGREKNLETARFWYAAAAAQGFELARERLEALDLEGAAPTASEPALTLHGVELTPATVAPGETMTLEWELTAVGGSDGGPVPVELSYRILRGGDEVYRSRPRSYDLPAGRSVRRRTHVRTDAAGEYRLVAIARLGGVERIAEKSFRVH